ncbi:zinc finger BED domain-containing protein 4 isoform X2 [Drosophila grimshawi]|uniref:zinc finger BED domain-containing protein 4 isoform X2 n=1 Tax=Drosophila grimshawi TaxID=7222 RepID=UPI000C87070A|nr:zinc finger BED domain-containing protein 4 isoform X2 [Drosophila grimshawi]
MSKKSRVWNFFYKQSDTVAICCLCHNNYSRKGRGTTCLRNHLKSKHPVEFLTLSENDMKYTVKTEMNESTATQISLQDADPLDDMQRHSEMDMHASDEKLALMIARHDYSFYMIEDAGFVNFIKMLQPRYTIRPISFYENIIATKIYQRMQTQLQQELYILESVTLATSISWDSVDQGLLSLTCHGISSDFQLKQYYLKCDVLFERNADDIACRIRNIISSASLDLQLPKEKIHCVIRDEFTCPPGAVVECNVHLLKECIVKHFEESQMAYDHLRHILKKRLNRDSNPLMAIDESPFGWIAIFRRLLKLKDALTIYAEEYNLVTIYPDEWLDIEICNRVVQPIEEIINIWCKTSSTASTVIPLIAALRDSLRTDVHNFVSSVTICSFARKLLEELESRCAPLTTDIKYLIATYLDPRYKHAFFTQQEMQQITDEVLAQLCGLQPQPWQTAKLMTKAVSNVKSESKIDSFLDNMLTSNSCTEASSSWNSQAQLKNLLYLYNSEPKIERQSDPIGWWKCHPKYRDIFPIVRRYLSIPAASVASGRVFSASKKLYNDMKLEVYPANGSKILFVKANLEALHQDQI